MLIKNKLSTSLISAEIEFVLKLQLKKKRQTQHINLKYAVKKFYSPKYSKIEFTYKDESDLLALLSRERK